MTSEATTDSQGRLPAGDFDSRAGHPVPFSTPGRWTISTLNGLEVSGYLPDWAEDDPSEAHVLLSLFRFGGHHWCGGQVASWVS
jgi:hypothetical protein